MILSPGPARSSPALIASKAVSSSTTGSFHLNHRKHRFRDDITIPRCKWATHVMSISPCATLPRLRFEEPSVVVGIVIVADI